MKLVSNLKLGNAGRWHFDNPDFAVPTLVLVISPEKNDIMLPTSAQQPLNPVLVMAAKWCDRPGPARPVFEGKELCVRR